MNINIWTFLQQCAAMAVWVFLIAALWSMVERMLNTYFPGFLDVEEAGASQAPAPPVASDTAKQA